MAEDEVRPGKRVDQSKDFFISYNGADKAWAEWIAWQLEEANFSTILQAWDFRPGDNFVLKMQDASKEAERMIAVLSPDYLNAVYTQPEWAAAFKRDPKGTKGILVPVMVRDCRQELEGLWPQIVYINLVDLSEQAASKVLLEGIRKGRSKPTVPPIFPGVVEHTEAVEHRFPGQGGGVSSSNSSDEELTLPKPKMDKAFNHYEVRDEWIEYITSSLKEAVAGEDALGFYANDAQGKRQIRILVNQRTVYSLDIFRGSMGGSGTDDGISFSYAEGRVAFSSGFNATGNFKWDSQKELPVLELLDFSLLSHAGGSKHYTKEEFLQELWNKILQAIERSTGR